MAAYSHLQTFPQLLLRLLQPDVECVGSFLSHIALVLQVFTLVLQFGYLRLIPVHLLLQLRELKQQQ